MKRIFLIVLDSFGIGAAPDAGSYSDTGANTLESISKSDLFCADNLMDMGLFNIDGVDISPKAQSPVAAYGRLSEKSAGKDTTTGHWEIAGIISKDPMPTYPDGFPDDIIQQFSEQTGRKVLCNKPYSGTEVIKDYGAEQLESGGLIVYTSADSVFQIAAHTDVVPLEQLYEYCRIARGILTGKNAVSRVIARPFTGTPGSFVRTADRRDFSLEPPGVTILDVLSGAGFDVIAVGKITDIFAGRGITSSVFTHSNNEGMSAARELLKEQFDGLCFINLVDFDMLYGHRNDVDGYAKAISEFDAFLPGFTENMLEDDILIITADHGCDPADKSTDHTREYIPVLIYGKKIRPVDLKTHADFGNIAKTIADIFNVDFETQCEGFAGQILS